MFGLSLAHRLLCFLKVISVYNNLFSVYRNNSSYTIRFSNFESFTFFSYKRLFTYKLKKMILVLSIVALF